MSTDPDAEDLIARLCGGLASADREDFRHAAETALASSPQCCWGPGSLYRTLVPLWREYFHPPPDNHDRANTWEQGRRRTSQLINAPPIAPPIAPRRDRRRSRGLKLVV